MRRRVFHRKHAGFSTARSRSDRIDAVPNPDARRAKILAAPVALTIDLWMEAQLDICMLRYGAVEF
jgi:hypothetical protein